MKKLFLLLFVVFILFSCNKEQIVDTDGDGYTDTYEESMFSMDKPLQYNKYISDLPLIDIRMVSEPVISINYEGSITRTITSASSNSSTTGRENTTSSENSDTISMGVNASLTDFGISMDASSTYTFGQSTTNSYSSTFERSRAYENSTQVSFSEAKIMCPIYIRNVGPTPIIINDMILTAYVLDYYGNIKAIGNLTLDNSELKELALDKNSSDIILNFKNDTLYPSELEQLFANAKSISVVLSSFSVEDKSYYNKKSDVASKTVRLSIIHSKPNLSRKLDIAVEEDNLNNILTLTQIPFDDNLYYVDNERADFNFDGYTWAINHSGIRDNTPFNDTYNIINKIDTYNLIIRQGDNVTLYRDNTHWEDSPLGDDLFYYYNDFAKINFMGTVEGNNYWTPQYVTYLSRRESNKNIGDKLVAEMFIDKMPNEIYVEFKTLPLEVMVNDEVIEPNYVNEKSIIIRDITKTIKIEFRFREQVEGRDGQFNRYVQSYTIRYKE